MEMKWDKFPLEAVHIVDSKGMNADIVHKVCFYKSLEFLNIYHGSVLYLNNIMNIVSFFSFSSVSLVVGTSKWWVLETSAKSFFDILKHNIQLWLWGIQII
jgi:hypothetical protein